MEIIKRDKKVFRSWASYLMRCWLVHVKIILRAWMKLGLFFPSKNPRGSFFFQWSPPQKNSEKVADKVGDVHTFRSQHIFAVYPLSHAGWSEGCINPPEWIRPQRAGPFKSNERVSLPFSVSKLMIKVVKQKDPTKWAEIYFFFERQTNKHNVYQR